TGALEKCPIQRTVLGRIQGRGVKIFDGPIHRSRLASARAGSASAVEPEDWTLGACVGTVGAFPKARRRVARGAIDSSRSRDMKSQMWVVRVVPVASAMMLAAAPVAFAQYGQYGSGSEL